MKHRKHDFKRALVLFLMHVHRNTTPVVHDSYRVVLIYSHVYVCRISGKSLVDRVVNHLIYQVMKTLHTNIAYIHRRALAHSFKSFKHLDITRAVFFFLF